MRERINEFISVRHGHLLPYNDRPEPRLASACVALAAAAAVVVSILLTATNTLVLANTSAASLPGISRGADCEITHRNVVERVEHLTGAFETSIGYATRQRKSSTPAATTTDDANAGADPDTDVPASNDAAAAAPTASDATPRPFSGVAHPSTAGCRHHRARPTRHHHPSQTQGARTTALAARAH